MGMYRFEAIFSHPDHPEEGTLAHVDARSRGAAQDNANEAVQDPYNVFHGCQFTIWPHPVGTV